MTEEHSSHPAETSSGVEPEPRRLNRYTELARARLEATRASAEARRDESRLVDTGLLLFERNRDLPATLLMGAVAARLVIFVVPLLVLQVFAIGLFADLAATSPQEAARQAGLAGLFAQAAEDTTTAGEGWRLAALLGTVFATLYAATGLGRLVRRIHAIVWRVPFTRAKRPWLIPVAVMGVALVGLALMSFSSWSTEWTIELFVGELVIELIVVTVFWMVITRSLPHDPGALSWGHFVPGGLFAAVGVVAVRVAMVVYFAPRSVTLGDRYGTVAVALVLLTWAYWLGFIVVGSADLNAAVFRSRQRRLQALPPRGGHR